MCGVHRRALHCVQRCDGESVELQRMELLVLLAMMSTFVIRGEEKVAIAARFAVLKAGEAGDSVPMEKCVGVLFGDMTSCIEDYSWWECTSERAPPKNKTASLKAYQGALRTADIVNKDAHGDVPRPVTWWHLVPALAYIWGGGVGLGWQKHGRAPDKKKCCFLF